MTGIRRRRLLVEWLERRDLLAAVPDDRSDFGGLFSGHSSVCNCPICTGQGLEQIAPLVGQSTTEAGFGSPLSSLPQLRSNPTAAARLFLDFDGHFEATWGTWSNITTPAFDVDGDAATFSSGELAAIQEIWARVSEDYAPFNIDVTTIDPGPPTNGVVGVIAIGGSSSDWYGTTAGGISFVGGFYNAASNVGYAFSSTLGGITKNTAEASAHEAGHLFGLQHQARWNGSTLVDQYNPGDNGWAPIMGVGYYQPRTTWHNGATPFGPNVLQDDLAILANSNNGFGWRADDYGNTLATAAVLPVAGSTVNVAGLIGQNGDQDVWSFHTVGGQVSLQLTGVAQGTNLDAVLELRGAAGQTLAVADSSESFGASLSRSLVAGDYFVVARSTGVYGSLGQYTISGTVPQGPFAEIAVQLDGASLADGQPLDFGTTLQGLPVDRTIAIRNDGNSPLVLTPLSSSSLPAGFALVAGLGQTTLAPGQSTSFTLRLSALAAGAFGGAFQLFSNDADESPFDLALAGTVTAPEITVRLNGSDLSDGQTVDLGSAVQSNPVNHTFTVLNDGTHPLLLTPLDPARLPAGFSLIANLGLATLSPGQSTTFTIRLDAASGGTFGGPLELISSDPDESPFDLTLTAVVTSPEITVRLNAANVADGQTVDLGTAGLGQPILRTFDVSNDGATALSLTPLNPAILPVGFTLVSNLGLTSLAPGQATSFTVRLDATAVGNFGGFLRLGNNDADENPFDLQLVGRVAGQEITVQVDGVSLVDGGTVDFGTATLASPVSRTFAVRNDGLSPLSLTALNAAALPAGFTLAANLGVTSLAPGEATSFTVRLNANATGTFGGPIQLLNDDADESPFDITLAGRVAAPEITLRVNGSEVSDGGLVEFGSALRGQPIERTFTIINDGGAPLNLSPLNQATLPEGFSLAANLGATTLAPGQSTTFAIRLVATTLGSFSGPLALATSDPDENPFDLLLAGSVIAPEIAVEVEGVNVADGETIDFGVTMPGAPVVRTIVVRNEGTALLNLAAIHPAAVPAGFVLMVNPTPLTLAPGQSTSFLVRLEAAATGVYSGPLGLPNNDEDENPFDLLLTGSVTAPEINVQLGGAALTDGQAVDFGVAIQGTPVNREFTVVNVGSAALSLTPFPAASLPAGFSLVSNVGLTTLDPGQSTQFTLRLDAQAAGTFGGAIALTNSDADENPFDLIVAGSVAAPEIAVELAGLNLASGQTVDLGTTPLALAVSRTFTISNTGTSSLGLAPLDPAAIPAGFTLVSNLGQTTLAPGETTSFALRLDATVAGSFGGELAIASNDADENPFTLAISGRVSAPEIAVRVGTANIADGETIDFGSTLAGQPVDQTFTVVNEGQAPLALAPLSPGGLPAGFSLVANLGAVSLAPGQATSFTVRLDAAAGGTFDGPLQLVNNDPDEGSFDLVLTGYVAAPEIRVEWSGIDLADGQAFDFGGTLAGVPLDRTFVVHNAGTAPLGLTPLAAANVPTGFGLLSNITHTTLAPGESTAFTVRLLAADSGAFGGPVRLANTDSDENPFDLLLSGSVSVPEIAMVLDALSIASGQTIDFGATLVGAPQSRTFTIHNIGASPLLLAPLNPASVPAGFTIDANLSATTLAPGHTTSFTISLNAAAIGAFSGPLAVANNDPDESPFQLQLTGSVIAPEIAVLADDAELFAGQAVDFGIASQGQPLVRTFTVVNQGGAPLTLAPLETGDLPAGFSLATGLGQSLLPPGQATSFAVRLDAAAAGSFAGSLWLSSDDADESSFELQLTGGVIAPEITVLVDGLELAEGQTIDFGATLAGSSSSRTITIVNDGDAPLALSPLSPLALPAGFTLVANVGATSLAPGGATTFEIRLSGATAGTYGGSVALASSDADENPFEIVLAGVLTAPEIAVAVDGAALAAGQTVDWGATVQGVPVARNFTVTNVGGAPLEVTPLNPASLPAGFSLVANLSASTLAPGESTTFAVRLDAAAVGDFGGNLSLGNSDADESPFALLLRGGVIAVANTNVELDLPAGGGDYTLERNGGLLQLRRGSQTLFARSAATVASLAVHGTSDRETLTVSYAGGNPVPLEGLMFDAGASGAVGDLLILQGAGNQAMTWTPGNLATGGGSASALGATIVYTGVESLDIAGMSLAQLQFGAGEHSLALSDGAAHGSGAPALVVRGLAAGQSLPAIALLQNSIVALNASPANAAPDQIALQSGAGSHGNANLSINTGIEFGDRIDIWGAGVFSGVVSLTSHDIAFTQAASVLSAPSVLLDATGSILDSSPSQPSVQAAALVATAAADITLGTAVDSLRARITGAGDLTVQEADGVALEDLYAANGDVRVVAGGAVSARSVRSGAAAARDLSVSALGGSLEVGTVGGYDGTQVRVALSAAGAVVPLATGQLHVRAAALTVQAGTGIGSQARALETAIATLVAAGGSGGVYVSNAGDLIVGASGAGDVTITASGNLDVAGSVVASGSASTLSLYAAQNLTVGHAATIAAVGEVRLQFGQAASAIATRVAALAGQVFSLAGVLVSGSDGLDRITVASGRVFSAPLVTLLGRGGDDAFILKPQTNASLVLRGGESTGNLLGDILDLDLSYSDADPQATAIVSTAGGLAQTTGYGDVAFSQFEGILLRDQGVLTSVGLGDLYIRGTQGADIIEVGPAITAPLVRVRINDRLETLAVTTRTLIVGRGGNDALAQLGVGLPVELRGDGGDDSLSGDSGHDVLVGGAGRDVLNGDGGDDYLAGGEGDDALFGGAGNDRLYGGAGDDALSGSDGDDLLAGNDGHDQLHGGLGQDVLIGGNGADVLSGHEGHDLLFANRLTTNGGSPASSSYLDSNDWAMAELLADWAADSRIDRPFTILTDSSVDLIFGGEGNDTAALGPGDNGDWDYLLP